MKETRANGYVVVILVGAMFGFVLTHLVPIEFSGGTGWLIGLITGSLAMALRDFREKW